MQDSRTGDDAFDEAREILEQAKTLAGVGSMSDREFLESVARSDRFIEGEHECGFNAKILIEAQVARELLAEGEVLDGMKKWVAFMDAYYPEGDRKSIFTTYAYSVAELLVHVLRQCGDDISRANIMRQATNLKAVKLDLLLPGLAVNTSPTDYRVVKEFRMMRFTGERWEAFGPMVTD